LATQIGFAEDMMSAYPTSKGALLQLIRSTAVEYARYGVRVNARCPGAVDTTLPRKHLATAEDPDAARRRIESVTPAGRLLTPGESPTCWCSWRARWPLRSGVRRWSPTAH
jgi:NAD(P)-dependent dehydrogenase (short-subunit alcohol dehydrogenase family)